MRLIDADELKRVFNEVCSNEILLDQILMYIDSVETVVNMEICTNEKNKTT